MTNIIFHWSDLKFGTVQVVCYMMVFMFIKLVYSGVSYTRTNSLSDNGDVQIIKAPLLVVPNVMALNAVKLCKCSPI